jgi:hypothetical protein
MVRAHRFIEARRQPQRAAEREERRVQANRLQRRVRPLRTA